MKVSTTIPFQGFYNSIHDSELDHALDMMFEIDDQGNTCGRLMEKIFDAVNWSDVHEAYAKNYVEHFAEFIELNSLIFEELVSPKYYNFETDRIFCTIEYSEIEHIYNEIINDENYKKILE